MSMQTFFFVQFLMSMRCRTRRGLLVLLGLLLAVTGIFYLNSLRQVLHPQQAVSWLVE